MNYKIISQVQQNFFSKVKQLIVRGIMRMSVLKYGEPCRITSNGRFFEVTYPIRAKGSLMQLDYPKGKLYAFFNTRNGKLFKIVDAMDNTSVPFIDYDEASLQKLRSKIPSILCSSIAKQWAYVAAISGFQSASYGLLVCFSADQPDSKLLFSNVAIVSAGISVCSLTAMAVYSNLSKKRNMMIEVLKDYLAYLNETETGTKKNEEFINPT